MSELTRRSLLAASAATMAAPLPAFSPAALASPLSSPATQEPAMADKSAIRPFHFEASKDDLADLKRRVAATRWPDKETVSDQSQGVQLAIAKKIQEHWAKHDWRKLEARM